MARQEKILLITAVLTGLILVAAANRTFAGEETAASDSVTVAETEDRPVNGNQRRGFLLGLNGGFGAAGVSLEVGSAKVEDNRSGGFFGGWRAGYAVSNSIALCIEGRNFYRNDTQGDWQMYGIFGTLTWWPDASGFYLRIGLGGGKINTVHHVGDLEIPLEHDEGLFLGGLGYEWRATRKFALGLGFDFFGGATRDENDIAELSFGSGGLTLQMNWYL